MILATLWLWLGFNAFVLALPALDLGVFNRTAQVISYREAATWSVVWIDLAPAMGVGLYLWRGPDVALQFFTVARWGLKRGAVGADGQDEMRAHGTGHDR